MAEIQSRIAPFEEEIEALKRSYWPAFLRSGKSELDKSPSKPSSRTPASVAPNRKDS